MGSCDGFEGVRCLPGRLLHQVELQQQLCDDTRQPGAANSICHSCHPEPAPCSTWASGTLRLGGASEGEGPLLRRNGCDGPQKLEEGSASQVMVDVAVVGGVERRVRVVWQRWKDRCQRPAMSREAFVEKLAALEGRTVLFVGDSLMRQLFLRTIAWLRRQYNVVDVPFHNDALYLVSQPHAGLARDALLPLWDYYRADCAIELLERRETARCREQRLAPRPAGGNKEVREIGIAVGQVEAWLRETAANWSGTPHVRLVYRFNPGYDTEFWEGMALAPAVVVAGAIGGHVPCWSNGQPGNRCSIENLAEHRHRTFWNAARVARRADARLRLLTWVTFPFGHTGSRYQNGNYSHFNERARHEILSLRGGTSAHVRVLPFDKIARQPGLTHTGVLAIRQDTTHFMCIMKGFGVGFYPYLRGDSVRYHKILTESASGRRTLEKEVTCMQPICVPHISDGCADETNLINLNVFLGHLKTI